MQKKASTEKAWGSRVGLILAMAGNAVGLGNFLRFPVQAIQNGGGTFIIPYLVSFILMGIPLLWVEWSMGRFGGKTNKHSPPFILGAFTKQKIWMYFGVLGMFNTIAITAYYCYIESWTITYVIHSFIGTFAGMSQAEVANFFTRYINLNTSTFGLPFENVVIYIACLLLNVYILSRGLSGIEKLAKIGMPLLLIFAAFLAIKGLTIGTSGATAEFPTANAFDGLNFLWTPNYDTLWNPKVWLAAAGQIFFTLSLGMGSIHCYASYVKSKDDIALNAVSAGFMNEFVEIVLGSMVLIPIAAGYLGLDWIKENASFGMAFQTMPYLFEKFGPVISNIAGVFWFGLLFFAGITSSLAMGTPWIAFMQDEFKTSVKKGAWTFFATLLVIGLPSVIFFEQGVFDEYDYWAGTVSLVILACVEIILFAWVHPIDKSWNSITDGADIKVPIIFKYIIKYVTPLFLLIIFISALVTPINIKEITINTTNNSQVVKKLLNSKGFYNIQQNEKNLTASIQAETFEQQFASNKHFKTYITDTLNIDWKMLNINSKQDWEGQFTNLLNGKTWQMNEDAIIAKLQNKDIQKAIRLAGTDTKKIKQLEEKRLYINFSRFLLLALLIQLLIMVYLASKKQ